MIVDAAPDRYVSGQIEPTTWNARSITRYNHQSPTSASRSTCTTRPATSFISTCRARASPPSLASLAKPALGVLLRASATT
jgi:hypothetical protein